MPRLPTVAIIGRPNTGKSTLFNRLIGARKAIECDTPGTTRDHITARVETENMSFLLIDTGGIGTTHDKDFEEDVKEQSLLALEYADLILFTVNSREDITADDRTIVDHLRKKSRRHVPVLTVLTKVDNADTLTQTLADFQEMMIGDDVVAVSAFHYFGFDRLRFLIERELLGLHFTKQHVPQSSKEHHDEQMKGKSRAEKKAIINASWEDDEENPLALKEGEAPRIAIIGRPNVGKSSIVNALMTPEQREHAPLLVSDIAGTTRDSIDTEIRYQEKSYILVDTAGLKKHAMKLDQIERFSMMRTFTAIENSDIILLVIDAVASVSNADKRIASLAIESGKGLIILVNKIDQFKGEARKERLHEISMLLDFCDFAKFIPCSAVTREGLLKLFDVVEMVARNRCRRLTATQLRKWFDSAVHGKPLGEVTRVKYIVQARDIPPTFVLFTKQPKRLATSQLRYLENRLRESFGFDGTPIRFLKREVEEK